MNSHSLTLLSNAQLFSPEPLGLKHILIGGGKILYLGDHCPKLDDKLNVSQHDLDGAIVLPGFIDGHVHITGGGGEAGGFSTRVSPLPISEFSKAGVTTVIGLLGTDDTARSTESLVAQTYALREQGMSAYCYTGGYHLPATTLTGNVKTDIVFIEPILGMGELAISDHRSSQPSLQEVLRVASECHVAGLLTGKAGILHLHLGDGPRGLSLISEALDICEIPARTFNPTHVNRQRKLFDEACELATRGCTIDITACDIGPDGYDPVEAVLRYLNSGLPVDNLTLSSDGGGCLPCFDTAGNLLHMDFGRPSTLTTTFQALVAEGLPLEIIAKLLSTNWATLLRLSRKGRVTFGSDADLVVFSKNELKHVMANGEWLLWDSKQILKKTSSK